MDSARYYVQDYVQDERYIAIEHMDVRRDCVNFAQRISTCMGAEVAQYLSSGLATRTSMSLKVLNKVPRTLGSVGNLSSVVSDS